jgi:integrase
MLSTCCRVGEIIQARWEHIDPTAGTWRIPPDNSKNKKEHTVWLSDFSKAQFKILRQLVEDAAMKKESEPSPWVLPATQRDGHVCLKSLSKQVGDRQRGDKPPMSNRTKMISALELPRGRWTPHDLRRTGATMMGALGARPDVIEKCLNHIQQNRLVRIYQRQALLAEQAEAWRLLGSRLELLTRPDEDNVVILGRGVA